MLLVDFPKKLDNSAAGVSGKAPGRSLEAVSVVDDFGATDLSLDDEDLESP